MSSYESFGERELNTTEENQVNTRHWKVLSGTLFAGMIVSGFFALNAADNARANEIKMVKSEVASYLNNHTNVLPESNLDFIASAGTLVRSAPAVFRKGSYPWDFSDVKYRVKKDELLLIDKPVEFRELNGSVWLCFVINGQEGYKTKNTAQLASDLGYVELNKQQSNGDGTMSVATAGSLMSRAVVYGSVNKTGEIVAPNGDTAAYGDIVNAEQYAIISNFDSNS